MTTSSSALGCITVRSVSLHGARLAWLTEELLGGDADDTLIASKWESLAVASVQDDRYPDDYFVFTAVRLAGGATRGYTDGSQADNDFITTDGVSVGEPYDAGADVANQFLVFRATLPGYSA